MANPYSFARTPTQRIPFSHNSTYRWQFRCPQDTVDRMELQVRGESLWPDLCPVDWTGSAVSPITTLFGGFPRGIGGGIPWWRQNPLRTGCSQISGLDKGYAFDWCNFDRCSQVAEG